MAVPQMASIKQPETPATAPQPQQAQVNIEQLLGEISRYGSYGTALRRATTMQEVGTQLARIAEMAEHAVVSEAEDWYDAHTLQRHMKEIKAYTKEFLKLAAEADGLNSRMTALYEDMGRVLERYFELPQDEAPQSSAVTSTGVSRHEVPMEESCDPVEEDKLHPSNPSEPVIQTPEDVADSETGRTRRTDEITLRAIKAVFNRLKQKNPEMASRFAALPPAKMKELVWKLVGSEALGDPMDNPSSVQEHTVTRTGSPYHGSDHYTADNAIVSRRDNGSTHCHQCNSPSCSHASAVKTHVDSIDSRKPSTWQ